MEHYDSKIDNQFIALNKVIYVINYWGHGSENVIAEILESETDLREYYIDPFKKELNLNLLQRGVKESNINLIKFYIFEFYELQGFYKRNYDLLFNGSISNISNNRFRHKNENGEWRILDDFENYVILSHTIFDCLFNEIQLCCAKYSIDFYQICDELNFSMEYFDSGITMAFNELKDEKLSTQTINFEIKFINNFDNVNSEKVYLHFYAGLVESKMLSIDELKSYLKSAFESIQQPKKLFCLKNIQTKNKVIKVFYNYYKNIAGKPHGKQKDYSGLLGNYFQGFNTKNVSTNFSK